MAEGSSDYEVKESLEAAEYIAEKAQDVTIDDNKVIELAIHATIFLDDNKEHHLKPLTNIFLRPETYPGIRDPKAIDWLFVLHTLNFSLLNPKGTTQWTVNNKDGYFGLCSAVKRAIDEGKRLWDPYYYAELKKNELEYIFRSDDGETSIPLIDKRLSILHEVGETLKNKYEGTFVKYIERCNNNTDILFYKLFNDFESYRDEAIYEGEKVCLHTKANSLVSDIWGMYRKEHVFRIDARKTSTMFIEHRAPMVLYHFGVLRYSDRLVTKFKNNNEPLEHGSREELEIRGCSLVAVNKMFKFIHQQWCEQNTIIPLHYFADEPLEHGSREELEIRGCSLVAVNKMFKDIQQQWREQNIIIPLHYNALNLIDNFLFGFLETKLKAGFNEIPFHYIRSVHY